MLKDEQMDLHHLVREIVEPFVLAPVECDGFTRIAHTALFNEGIAHTCMKGRMIQVTGNQALPIHFWIVLADGHVVDYRARMWLGDDTTVPHGVFNPAQFPTWAYSGEAVNLPLLSAAVVQALLARPPAFNQG